MSLGGGYLPPLVTELKSDIGDLARGFTEAEALGKEYAATQDKTITEGMGNAGRNSAREFRKEVTHGLDGVGNDIEKAAARSLPKVGRSSGKGWLSGFSDTVGEWLTGGGMTPWLIGAAVIASPMIASLIGSAVSVGLGLGFAGVGTLLAVLLIPKVNKAFMGLGNSLKSMLKYAVSGNFDDALIRALNRFKAYLPGIGHELRGIFDQVAPFLGPLVNALGAGLVGFLKGISEALKNSGPAIQTFISTIPMVFSAVGQFFADITKDGPDLQRFILDAANAIVKFLDLSGKVIAWLEKVDGWVVKINDNFEIIGWGKKLETLQKTIIPAVGAGLAWLWGKIKDGAKAVKDWAVGIWDAVTGWVSRTYDSIKKWISDTIKAIGDWVAGVVDWFKSLPGKIWAFIQSIPGILKRAWHQLLYDVGFFIGAMIQWWIKLPGRIVHIAGLLWTLVKNTFKHGVDQVVGFVKWLVAAAVGYWTGLWHSGVKLIKDLWNGITHWFKKTKDDSVSWIEKAYHGVVDWLKKLPGEAVKWVIKVRDGVVNFFKSAPGWLYQAGKDMLSGLWNGISDALGWIVDKVKGAAHDIIHGFKDAMGIASPSKVFHALGGFGAQGWVNGFKEGLAGMGSVMSSMATGPTVTMAMGASASRSSGYYGGPGMVHTTVNVDGQAIVRAITPAAQRRKARSGESGLA